MAPVGKRAPLADSNFVKNSERPKNCGGIADKIEDLINKIRQEGCKKNLILAAI